MNTNYEIKGFGVDHFFWISGSGGRIAMYDFKVPNASFEYTRVQCHLGSEPKPIQVVPTGEKII